MANGPTIKGFTITVEQGGALKDISVDAQGAREPKTKQAVANALEALAKVVELGVTEPPTMATHKTHILEAGQDLTATPSHRDTIEQKLMRANDAAKAAFRMDPTLDAIEFDYHGDGGVPWVWMHSGDCKGALGTEYKPPVGVSPEQGFASFPDTDLTLLAYDLRERFVGDGSFTFHSGLRHAKVLLKAFFATDPGLTRVDFEYHGKAPSVTIWLSFDDPDGEDDDGSAGVIALGEYMPHQGFNLDTIWRLGRELHADQSSSLTFTRQQCERAPL